MGATFLVYLRPWQGMSDSTVLVGLLALMVFLGALWPARMNEYERLDAEVPATGLFRHCDRLFAVLEHPGVEPTNNSAERALRQAVVCCKSSFGNQSAKGEVATARFLTVARTCVRQRRNAQEFLCDSASRGVAVLRNQAVSSAIPLTASISNGPGRANHAAGRRLVTAPESAEALLPGFRGRQISPLHAPAHE
jgi:hypothetical protein